MIGLAVVGGGKLDLQVSGFGEEFGGRFGEQRKSYAASGRGELIAFASNLDVFKKSQPIFETVLILVDAIQLRGIDLITRSDGRAVFISSLDRLETNGNLAISATAPNGPPVVGVRGPGPVVRRGRPLVRPGR